MCEKMILNYDIKLEKNVSFRSHMETKDEIVVLRELGYSLLQNHNYVEALDMYMKAFKLGENSCAFLNNIGYASEMCELYEQALVFYILSASAKRDENTTKFAFLNIAYMYENGLGVPVNLEMAASYYEIGKDDLLKWKKARKMIY